MRKVLITFAILNTFIGAAYASWIYGGRQLSLFIDQFGTIKIAFGKVNSIAYQGGGTAGVLIVNDVIKLRLNEAAPNLSPSIGSTKDNQLALANGGKVFAFGPLACSHCLATAPHAGDDASLIRCHSALSWPTPFDLNVMNGESPSWRRPLARTPAASRIWRRDTRYVLALRARLLYKHWLGTRLRDPPSFSQPGATGHSSLTTSDNFQADHALD